MRSILRSSLDVAGHLGRRRSRLAGKKRAGWRRLATAFGAVAMLIGASMIALGLYDYVQSGEASIPEQPPALVHRNDPGSIYDRPAGQLTPTPSPAPTPAVTEQPTATPAPTPEPPPPPPLRDQPYRIVIDKIGVNAGVYTYGLDENAIPEVPLNGWDVAWYSFSAEPGTGSNAVMAAHVTWNGPAVFYNLDALVPGDEVRLVNDQGVELLYRVKDTFLVDPEDPEALAVMRATEDDMLTLITCGGTPYWVGGQFGYDYTARQIVRAELVEVTGV